VREKNAFYSGGTHSSKEEYWRESSMSFRTLAFSKHRIQVTVNGYGSIFEKKMRKKILRDQRPAHVDYSGFDIETFSRYDIASARYVSCVKFVGTPS
jgi:hypothetical protein